MSLQFDVALLQPLSAHKYNALELILLAKSFNVFSRIVTILHKKLKFFTKNDFTVYTVYYHKIYNNNYTPR